MNILINTPLLKSHTLKEKFDNKILVVFLLVIIIMMVSGLVFIDLVKSSSGSIPENGNNSQIPQKTSSMSV